jgi:hypothetical protein
VAVSDDFSYKVKVFAPGKIFALFEANALAYYEKSLLTAVKRFITLAPGRIV